MEVVNAIGRRKAAVARVFVSEGTGVITINNSRRVSKDDLFTLTEFALRRFQGTSRSVAFGNCPCIGKN